MNFEDNFKETDFMKDSKQTWKNTPGIKKPGRPKKPKKTYDNIVYIPPKKTTIHKFCDSDSSENREFKKYLAYRLHEIENELGPRRIISKIKLSLEFDNHD